MESHGTLSSTSRLLSIHPIQHRLTHYLDEYTISLLGYQKVEPEGHFQGQKWGVFSPVLREVRTIFHFMNGNYFIKASSSQKDTLLSRWEVREIMKISLFTFKSLTTLACRNSLINPMTNQFYFGSSFCFFTT